ncbi:YggS family pyridoxal phosphate-dependent enzyme, partial [PVC group bacterium]|nr:YggS family pyridoxal phosphate-dependent enzyme [PVC group bacterium]
MTERFALESTGISERVAAILASLPPHVTLAAACKTRTPGEVREAVEAGVTVLGHNYVQEAESMVEAVGRPAKWHLIGHLQRNKAKKAVELFDVIETVDSVRLANALERHCAAAGKTVSVLVEVNSGEESNKAGVLPSGVGVLVGHISTLEHVRVRGLMTMGPMAGDPEEARPYFQKTKDAFDRLADAGLPNVEMQVLSMGMSNSYQVAVE